MSLPVVERKSVPVLGNDRRAGELVAWSTKLKPGKRWVKDFPFGLRIGFVSADSEPKAYIHWNQARFNQFLEQSELRKQRFQMITYGICISYDHGRTEVRLIGAGQTGVSLWDSERSFCKLQEKEDVSWLTGMIRFSETGPIFYTQAECKSELEEATAVAIIRQPKRKSSGRVPIKPEEKLPSPAPKPQRARLDQKARQFLARDVLLNVLLQNKKTNMVEK